MMVWQKGSLNEWAVTVRRALAGDEIALTTPPGAADPFSLGEQATVKHILSAAGYVDATFTDVHEPIYYGREPAEAFDAVLVLSSTKDILRRLGPKSRERALERLRKVLAAHHSGEGVWFNARAWIITARRR